MSETNIPFPAEFAAEARPAMASERSSFFDTRSLPPVIVQYWQTAVRWRLLIAGIIGGCLAIGLIATLLMAPLYTARTELEISREQKNVTNVEGLVSEQSGRDLEFYATQYALLKAEIPGRTRCPPVEPCPARGFLRRAWHQAGGRWRAGQCQGGR